MILFLGDSFTWGQGLQYIHLVEKKGWSWEDCSKIIPPKIQMEWLGFEEDEYRKQNSFPYLISKKIDLPFAVGRFENGGDNQTIYQMLNGIQPFISVNNIFCLVVQFSEPARSLEHEYDASLGDIDTQIKNQVIRIDEFCKIANLQWLGISWQPEIGNFLKEFYKENYVPIIYNGIEYTNFSTINSELNNIFLQGVYPIEDGHLNLEGHTLIAEMIYQKMLSNKEIQKKLMYYKETIKTIIEK
jgi:hypothetical protein